MGSFSITSGKKGDSQVSGPMIAMTYEQLKPNSPGLIEKLRKITHRSTVQNKLWEAFKLDDIEHSLYIH